MNKRKGSKDSRNGNTVGRARSTLSVSGVDYYLSLPVTSPPSSAVSTITLTPGRLRNIDQDMENLRASRQDNPFIQQVIASRESLIDSLDAEEESDHANLMAKELPTESTTNSKVVSIFREDLRQNEKIQTLLKYLKRDHDSFIRELSLDLEIDPLSLPEMHEHMIRSPPPTNWPKSPNYKVFQFPHGQDETISVEVNAKDSKSSEVKPKHSSWDGTDISPLRSLPKPHFHQERFSLLTPSGLRSSGEDSIRLMAED